LIGRRRRGQWSGDDEDDLIHMSGSDDLATGRFRTLDDRRLPIPIHEWNRGMD
jgi:hypothetical protein